MKRLDALAAVYDRLESCIVVTIMGAVAAELQSLGHRPNFFYLQHAMGLASSVGLGIALTKPQQKVVVQEPQRLLRRTRSLQPLAQFAHIARSRAPEVFEQFCVVAQGGQRAGSPHGPGPARGQPPT